MKVLLRLTPGADLIVARDRQETPEKKGTRRRDSGDDKTNASLFPNEFRLPDSLTMMIGSSYIPVAADILAALGEKDFHRRPCGHPGHLRYQWSLLENSVSRLKASVLISKRTMKFYDFDRIVVARHHSIRDLIEENLGRIATKINYFAIPINEPRLLATVDRIPCQRRGPSSLPPFRHPRLHIVIVF